jgi:hypothetical protein
VSKIFSLAPLAVALLASPAGPAGALAYEASVEFGTLTCMLGAKSTEPQASDEAGERRSITCRFLTGEKAPGETYVGTLQIVGPAARLPQGATLMMVARAPPTRRPTIGSIGQKYVAGARSADSPQPPPLVGERDNSVVLHPLTAADGQPSLALGQRGVIFIGLELRLDTAAG